MRKTSFCESSRSALARRHRLTQRSNRHRRQPPPRRARLPVAAYKMAGCPDPAIARAMSSSAIGDASTRSAPTIRTARSSVRSDVRAWLQSRVRLTWTRARHQPWCHPRRSSCRAPATPTATIASRSKNLSKPSQTRSSAALQGRQSSRTAPSAIDEYERPPLTAFLHHGDDGPELDDFAVEVRFSGSQLAAVMSTSVDRTSLAALSFRSIPNRPHGLATGRSCSTARRGSAWRTRWHV